ncbi:cathelicidin-like antimicrobial protein isoform 2-T2 [Cochliomyia hominivorax]
MKRVGVAVGEPVNKSTKYSLQTVASAGTPLTSFHWQPTVGGSNAAAAKKQQQLGAAINSLPPNTIIKATTAPNANHTLNTSNGNSSILTSSHNNSAGTTLQVRRPTIFIKREVPKRTIRTVTLELIEKNPHIHLGLHSTRLPLLKNVICTRANITLVDCYLTLKKLKQNEDFSLLAEYFEMSEGEVQQIFARTVVKLARYLRFLIRWPDSKRYYDRHKYLPFAFRQNLSHVQSLIECVETDMPASPLQIDCTNYKFILCINTNGIISYISDAFVGHHDDLTIFKAANFSDVIPKYLSLVADPGKAIRRKRKPKSTRSQHNLQYQTNNGETDSTTDSADESADDLVQSDEAEEGRLSKYTSSRVAGELASHQSLTVVNSELTSRRVKNFSIPTMRVKDNICRLQIRHMINCLHEFKILQPLAIQEPLLYQYLNEILIVCAALINLQR